MNLRIPLVTSVATSLHLIEPVAAADIVTKQQRAVEARVIESLRREMECFAADETFLCETQFQGLRVGFRGEKAPGRSSIHIAALGRNQAVSTFGRRCLLVTFTGEELGPERLVVFIVLRDDATFDAYHGDEKSRAACE